MIAEREDTDDLTETRERLALTLSGTDALLSALQLHSSVSVTDATGMIIDVNDSFCRICGYTREELLGESHAIVNSGVHGATFWAALWDALAAGQPWHGEICNRAKDGSLHWADCMIAPILAPGGRPTMYICIRHDISSSKNTEAKLRASEAFLDLTGQTAAVGGWELDVATVVLNWSAQMMRIHDLDPSYKPVLAEAQAHFPPRARIALEGAFAEACLNGNGWDLELPMVTARGRSIWVRTVCEPELADGLPVRLVGALQDITARKQIETVLAEERARMASLVAQLKAANAKFAIASEAAGIAIWEYDLAAQSIDWDDRMYAIYGLLRTDAPLDYQLWVHAVHPDDRAEATAALARAIRGDGDFETEFRIVRPNGDVRHVKAAARVLRGPEGGAIRITGVNIDVTGAKLAELQLFKTSSILRNVLDSAMDVAIIATDPNLIVKVFNVGAEHMLGYTSEEVVDRLTPAALHDQDELLAVCEKFRMEVGRPLQGWEVYVQPEILGRAQDCTGLRPDGSRVQISQVVNAMFTYEGELIGYLCIAHDVTRQREYERSLREATNRAEHANRAKSDFLANMSHEIRTPLNAVIGLSYLLRNTTLDETQSGFLSNIETASKSLLAIINDVLDLSKIEAGELMVEKTPFSPRDLVNEVVDVMRLYADAKGIEFRAALSPDLPPMLDGDPTRVKQILTNLLSNAIRFTDHGAVEVRVSLESDAAAQVGLCFTVKDTGIGIAPAAQARLFTPFAQADASITRRYGGTGLGLSIVKSLVKVLGGKLELESTTGVGSMFTVHLAFARTPRGALAAELPQPAVPGTRGLSGVRVLVVDDSDMNLDVVKYILEWEGAEVALARNGQEALDRLQTDTLEFDVVLMDVQMPVMDGHAATRSIRGELGLIDLPIIALTAGALSSKRDRAIAAGMDDFLIKPFEPSALVNCIRKHVAAASTVAGTPIARVTGPEQARTEWPEVDGIDSAAAKVRLSNDYGLFLSSLTRLLVEFSDVSMLEVGAQPGDLVALAARMHKLKGNAGTLGANAIHSLAAEAEAACLANSTERATGLVLTLATQLQRLRDSAAPVINAARARSEARDAAAMPPAEPLSPDLVGELVHLLRQHHLAALDRFRQIAPQLRQSLGPDAYERARDHVDCLQFNEAAAILQAAVNAMNA